MKTKILITAVLTSLVMTAAAAQDGPKRPDFAAFDANSDGGITLAELQAHGEDRFANSDANGDGALSSEELIANADGRAAERATQMLERFDENGDGLLQQAELPQRDGQRMFDRIDADSDGIITQAEFEALAERGPRGEGQRDQG